MFFCSTPSLPFLDDDTIIINRSHLCFRTAHLDILVELWFNSVLIITTAQPKGILEWSICWRKWKRGIVGSVEKAILRSGVNDATYATLKKNQRHAVLANSKFTAWEPLSKGLLWMLRARYLGQRRETDTFWSPWTTRN